MPNHPSMSTQPSLSPLAWAVAFAFFGMPAYAEVETDDQVQDLGTLTVTASRANLGLKESAQKMQVIDQKTIQAQLLAGDDMSQALSKLIPAYAPPTGNMGSVSESLRGREALFMVDGVPQSNPLRDGSRENRTIDLSMVERIEVIYGASAEQGLGATGGIINFVTKKNQDDGIKHRLSVGANIGKNFKGEGLGYDVHYQASFGGEKTDALVALKYGKEGMYYAFDDRMVGTYGNQGDIMNASHYDVFAKIGYDIDNDKRITASVNHYHLEGSQEYINDSSQRNRALKHTDTSIKRTGEPDGLNPYNKVSTANLSYQDHDFFGTKVNVQGYYQDFVARYGANAAANYQDPSLAPIGQLYDQSQIDVQKFGLKATVNKDDLWQDRLSLTAGLDALQDKSEQKLIRYNRSWTPLMNYQSLAPFVQARLRLFDRLSVNAGVRYEMGQIDIDDFYTLAGYTRATSFGARRYTPTLVKGGTIRFDKPLPNAGIIFDVTPNLQAFANYSQGLGLPDVGGTLRSITALNRSVENVELSPIVTDNLEAGLRWTGDKLSADISAYQSKSDLGSTLEYHRDVQGYRALRSKTDIKGAELSLGYRPNDKQTFTVSYAHTQGKYDANGDGVMVKMPARSISPNKLSLGYTHTLANQGSVGLSATHLFSRDYPDIAAGVPSTFDGYTLVDFSYRQPVSHRFGKGVIGIGVNNLLNADYQNFISQTVLADDSRDTTRYSSGRGRNYNLSYTFEF